MFSNKDAKPEINNVQKNVSIFILDTFKALLDI